MRNSIIRGALLGILLLGFTSPGVALAGGGEKGCSNLGTWFGVLPFPPPPHGTLLPPPWEWDDMFVTGWSVTVTGKSNNEGTNLFEYPIFDATLAILVDPNDNDNESVPYPSAVRLGSMRGNWKRTGGNTFDYTFMGFAYDAYNNPVYIAKVSGQVELINNCQYQETTAVMEVFAFSPFTYPDPFVDEPDDVFQMGKFYGYRATVEAPPPLVPY